MTCPNWFGRMGRRRSERAGSTSKPSRSPDGNALGAENNLAAAQVKVTEARFILIEVSVALSPHGRLVMSAQAELMRHPGLTPLEKLVGSAVAYEFASAASRGLLDEVGFARISYQANRGLVCRSLNVTLVLYFVAAPTTSSHGDANPPGPSNFVSSCPISSQEAARSASGARRSI